MRIGCTLLPPLWANREETDYVLDPVDVFGKDPWGDFPEFFKDKEIAEHGEYLTKRIILEMYDQMAALPTISVPAPKGEGEYRVPDVAQWSTWLDSRTGKSAGGTQGYKRRLKHERIQITQALNKLLNPSQR